MAGSVIPGVSSGPDAINVGGRRLPIALVAALASIAGVVLLVRHRGAASSTASGYNPTGSQLQGLEDQINTLQQQFGGLQGTVATLGATAGSSSSSLTGGIPVTMPSGAPAPAPAAGPNGGLGDWSSLASLLPPANYHPPHKHPCDNCGKRQPPRKPPGAHVAADMADRTPPIHLAVQRTLRVAPPPAGSRNRVQPRPGQRKPLPVTLPGGHDVVRRPGHPY
jgi:hypothetical protein